MFHQQSIFKLLTLSLLLYLVTTLAFFSPTGTKAIARDEPQEAIADHGAITIRKKPQRIFAPHWTTEENFSTTIYIRNIDVAQAINAKASLILDNRTVPLPTLFIGSLQTVALDVRKVLIESGEKPQQRGGAIIDFEAESAGAINAYAHVLDLARSLGLSFPFMENGAPASGPLDGVAWYHSKGTNAFVALQNTTDMETTALLTIFTSGRAIGMDKRRLRPYEVAVINLPSLEGLGNESDSYATGVRVEYDGRSGAVVAQGWMIDESIGFSLPIAFHPQSNCGCEGEMQHRYGTGIMLGKGGMGAHASLNSEEVLFSPYLALSNRSDQPLVVEPIFSYETGGNVAKAILPSMTLAAHESSLINLRDFQKKKVIPASVEMGNIDLQYKGQPGALVSELASVDQNGSFVSPVPLICMGNRNLHMPFWRTDGDWHSSMTIQNISSQENEVQITITYPGGQYILDKKIGSGSAIMVSINDLQQSQEPDRQGNRIPKDATVGGAKVWSPGISDGLVVNPMFMNPVAKTCGQCAGLAYVTASTMSDKAAFTGSPLYSGCDPHPVNLGVTLYYNLLYSDSSRSSGGLANNATSSSPSVAIASGSFISPVAPGTTTITAMSLSAYFTDPACSQTNYLGPKSVSLQIVPFVTVSEVGFTGDYQITPWPGGAVIDNPDGSAPTWKSSSNPDLPVAYKKGALPTMFARFGISPSAATTNVKIRVKNGSTVIAKKTTQISGTSVMITGLTVDSALENSVKTTSPSFTWEISFNAGTTWNPMGNSGPHTMYWTFDAPLSPPFKNTSGTTYAPLYDLALQKACGYANGGTNAGSITLSMAQGISGDIFYSPSTALPNVHPLGAYDSGGCLCADLAALLRGLMRSVGIDGTVNYIWAGPNATTVRAFTVGSTSDPTPSFRITRNQKDGADANPHFAYHAIVAIGSTWYDPSYGLSYTSLSFTETAFNNTPQQINTTFPTSVASSGFVCPH